MTDNEIIDSTLQRMQDAWTQAPINGTDEHPPAGTYTATVTHCDVRTTGSNGATAVKLRIRYAINDAAYNDRAVSQWHSLDDPNKLSWAKTALAKLGLKVDDLRSLPTLCQTVVGDKVVIDVTINTRNGKEYPNAYVQELLDESESKGKSNDIPF